MPTLATRHTYLWQVGKKVRELVGRYLLFTAVLTATSEQPWQSHRLQQQQLKVATSTSLHLQLQDTIAN